MVAITPVNHMKAATKGRWKGGKGGDGTRNRWRERSKGDGVKARDEGFENDNASHYTATESEIEKIRSQC